VRVRVRVRVYLDVAVAQREPRHRAVHVQTVRP